MHDPNCRFGHTGGCRLPAPPSATAQRSDAHEHAPNPSCCSSVRALCPKCSTTVRTDSSDTDYLAGAKYAASAAQKESPMPTKPTTVTDAARNAGWLAPVSQRLDAAADAAEVARGKADVALHTAAALPFDSEGNPRAPQTEVPPSPWTA